MKVVEFVISRLTIYMGGIDTGKGSWAHVRDIELANSKYDEQDPIDVLLGADAYVTIIGLGLRKRGVHESIAHETTLGWILSGKIERASSDLAHISQCRIEEDLCCLVRGFWEQEEFPAIRMASREECKEHFRCSHSRKADGRYEVRFSRPAA